MKNNDEMHKKAELAVKKALDIINKDAKDYTIAIPSDEMILGIAVEAAVKAWFNEAENLEIAKLQKQNEKLKAKNKRLCNELVEYKMVQNALETADDDDCFDEDDFFNL
jgi:hypothetical protein